MPITTTSDNRLSIGVSFPDAFDAGFGGGFAAGGSLRARVEFALANTQPTETSGQWILAGIMEAPGTLLTEKLPQDAIAWVRARSEADGHRPSDWAGPVEVALNGDPQIFSATLTISQAGVPTVCWTANLSTEGLLIEWDVVDDASQPTYPNSVEIDAKDPVLSGFSEGFDVPAFSGPTVRPERCYIVGATVSAGEVIWVRLTPYEAFTGFGSGFDSGFDQGSVGVGPQPWGFDDGFANGFESQSTATGIGASVTLHRGTDTDPVGSGFSSGFSTGYGS